MNDLLETFIVKKLLSLIAKWNLWFVIAEGLYTVMTIHIENCKVNLIGILWILVPVQCNLIIKSSDIFY